MDSDVPEGWERVRLGQVAEKRSGKFDPTENRNRPYVGLEHIDPGRTGIFEFGDSDATKSNKTEFRAGDVLFGKLRPYLEKVALAERDGVCSTDILALMPGKAVDPYFLYGMMARPKSTYYAVGHSRGTRMPRTSWKALSKMKVAIPRLPEQKKIAAILSTVDEAIEATEAVIEQTRRVKKGLLEELLTRGIGHEEFKGTRIGEIPKGWEVRRLRDIVINNGLQTGPYGSQLHASEYTEEGVPVIMPSDLAETEVRFDDAARVPKSKADELSKHYLEPGDIVFGRRGDIGRCALVRREQPILCGSGCLRARPGDGVESEFLIEFLQSNLVQRYLKANAVGQTMANLNTGILGAVPVALPPVEEQRRIADVLRTVTEQVGPRMKKLSSLRTLKKGLLQDLLTGEVRVGDVEVEAIEEQVEQVEEAVPAGG